jgi:hypothetical protein
MGKYLTKAAILAAHDLETEEVAVPEWGGTVLVRAMSARDRDALEVAIGGTGAANLDNVRARIVAASVVDEDGKRLFDPGDVVALGEKSAAAVDRVFTVAARLSAITPGDVETLAKN